MNQTERKIQALTDDVLRLKAEYKRLSDYLKELGEMNTERTLSIDKMKRLDLHGKAKVQSLKTITSLYNAFNATNKEADEVNREMSKITRKIKSVNQKCRDLKYAAKVDEEKRQVDNVRRMKQNDVEVRLRKSRPLKMAESGFEVSLSSGPRC